MIKNKHMNLSHKLYMGQGSIPTVDRPKVFRPSEIFVWDNKCSALDAEWECYPYALASCEQYRGTDGYLQCMDDRFHACRQAAGCNYTYNTSPSTCRATPSPRIFSLARRFGLFVMTPTRSFPRPNPTMPVFKGCGIGPDGGAPTWHPMRFRARLWVQPGGNE